MRSWQNRNWGLGFVWPKPCSVTTLVFHASLCHWVAVLLTSLLPLERLCSFLSHVWLFETPRTVALQAPLSMEFSRQEYWSGLPLSTPGDLPDPGIEPSLPHYRQILYQLNHQGSLERQSDGLYFENGESYGRLQNLMGPCNWKKGSIRIHFCFKTTVMIRHNPNLIPCRAVLGLHVLSWHFLFFPSYPCYHFTIVLWFSSSSPFREFGHLQSSDCGVSSSSSPFPHICFHWYYWFPILPSWLSSPWNSAPSALGTPHSHVPLVILAPCPSHSVDISSSGRSSLNVSTLAGSILDLVRLFSSLHPLLK